MSMKSVRNTEWNDGMFENVFTMETIVAKFTNLVALDG